MLDTSHPAVSSRKSREGGGGRRGRAGRRRGHEEDEVDGRSRLLEGEVGAQPTRRASRAERLIELWHAEAAGRELPSLPARSTALQRSSRTSGKASRPGGISRWARASDALSRSGARRRQGGEGQIRGHKARATPPPPPPLAATRRGRPAPMSRYGTSHQRECRTGAPGCGGGRGWTRPGARWRRSERASGRRRAASSWERKMRRRTRVDAHGRASRPEGEERA